MAVAHTQLVVVLVGFAHRSLVNDACLRPDVRHRDVLKEIDGAHALRSQHWAIVALLALVLFLLFSVISIS